MAAGPHQIGHSNASADVSDPSRSSTIRRLPGELTTAPAPPSSHCKHNVRHFLAYLADKTKTVQTHDNDAVSRVIARNAKAVA